jgi:hypothetical protein
MNLRSLARSSVYRLELVAQAARFKSMPEPPGGWPALLGISFPKSGTHLLDQILLGFSQVAPFARRLHSFYAEYEGETGAKRDARQALSWLSSLRGRDVASAHLFARPEVVQLVAAPPFVPYFVFRDPRDVVVSHVFYVTDIEPRHVHHGYYSSLPDFDSRLRASILGRRDAGVEFPDIASRFEPYGAWLDCTHVLKIHFEDLVQDRRQTLRMIVDRFLQRVSLEIVPEVLVTMLEASVDPARSPTYRSGKTGEWRKYFTDAHKELFKSVTGDLLSRLGYESSADW